LKLPSILPGDSACLRLAAPTTKAECALRLSLHLKQATNWADKGYQLGFESFLLNPMPGKPLATNHLQDPSMQYSETDSTLTVVGSGFSMTFEETSDVLASWKVKGKELLVKGPVLQAYRAYTDNDKGFGNWLAKDWKTAGLDKLEPELVVFKQLKRSKNLYSFEVAVSYSDKLLHTATYTLYGDGTLTISNRFEPQSELPVLPRLGIALQLASTLENLQWYGRGPWENYADRKDCTPVGLWKSTVTQQYVPYPRPQECGNKEDVRWLSLTDAQGKGLRIESSAPMSFSALHYTVTDLDKADFTWQLQARKAVVLSLDAYQLGLGNSSCGPGVLQKYAPSSQTATLNLTLNPLR
jgi:beta-galactosidase